MSFKIECPHCGQPIEVDDELSGAVASCPGCDRRFTVPEEPPPPVSRVVVDRPTAPALAADRASGAGDEWEEYSGNPCWLIPLSE